ncbi:MAG: dihydrolipoamide acetyltransferase family protein [Coxiellaceae bacterium]|nr:dihydrolipoamide acetyltransferase family protein [Coxiellaceae bacterium]
MKTFKLPDLGEGLPDAIIREWYINVGDEVKVDQPLVAMETAKALVDVPSPYHGNIEKLFGDVGDTINTHDPLIGFSGDAEEGSREDSGTVVGAIEVSGDVMTESATGVQTQKASGARAKVTPAVRALAKRLGVDLNGITGTGPQGMISKADVEAAQGGVAAAPKADAEVKGEVLSGLRRAMVMSMQQSHQKIVPVTLCDDADIQSWQKQDVTVRLIRAIQTAVQQEPLVNSYYHGETMSVETFKEVNVGMAVDTPEGLFVPVIKDVANLSDEQLREKINQFKQQAQTKSIAQDDLHGATIMLSNFGAFAGKYANPIIVPPMVCILGVGRSRDSAVVIDGNVEVHKLMPLSVTVDHRAVTGGEATRFLRAVMDALSSRTV